MLESGRLHCIGSFSVNEQFEDIKELGWRLVSCKISPSIGLLSSSSPGRYLPLAIIKCLAIQDIIKTTLVLRCLVLIVMNGRTYSSLQDVTMDHVASFFIYSLPCREEAIMMSLSSMND